MFLVLSDYLFMVEWTDGLQGPDTELANHTGWADLSNHVLRCHICLEIPEVGT
jgi:hypothetical protein